MLPWYELRWLVRELRGARGRWALFTASLTVGVAAVVAVAGLAASLRKGLEQEAQRLLAADLKIESRQPLPEELFTLLEKRAETRWSPQAELLTVVRSPQTGKTQLVELKAVGPGYPFYGRVEVEPPGSLEEALAKGGVVAPAELLHRLGIELGDPIEVGGEPFPILAKLVSEPDRITGAFAMGPRLFLPYDRLWRTGLTQFGSRVTYRLLIQTDRPEDLASEVRRLLGNHPRYRVETAREGIPELRQGLERAERFLHLVGLLSLALGGLGVAQTVRLWLTQRLDAIAVWKSLGASAGELLRSYLFQCLLLAATGSFLGVLLGQALVWLVPSWIGGLLEELPRANAGLEPIWLGLGVGVGVALGFALPPLSVALRVPAVRVLRSEVEPLPSHPWERVLAFLALAATLGLVAWTVTRSVRVAVLFLAAFGASLLVFGGLNQALIGLARWVPRPELPLAFRYGWAALGRPGSIARSALLALGVGSFLVVSVEGVRQGLLERLAAELPREAPTAFLLDVQPHQWEAVQNLLAARGATSIRSVPVVMARLTAVDGLPVRELLNPSQAEPNRERWALTREQRLTYLEKLPEDNEIVKGSLWADPEKAEISVEERFAQDLGIGLGSRLQFDVQGVPIELTVTSLRRVNWQTFQINFFFVVEPGVLEEAPQFRLAAARLAPGREAETQDALAAQFPNVTLIQIREVLDKVQRVLERISTGIRFLGLFTVTTGLAIVAASLGAAAFLRSREVALLKTLGLTRMEVVLWFGVEYALATALAAGTGSMLGMVAQTQILERAFTIEAPLRWDLLLGGTLSVTVLVTLTALLASLRPLRQSPADVFRS